MASILDRYGIKEVADVTFYEIDDNGQPSKPVLYLDTLKVSTIEQTAEQVDARGGKGNPKLITWDYGKEITVTLEDALFSAKSLSIMLGNGNATAPAAATVSRMAVVRAGSDSKLPAYFIADTYQNGGAVRQKIYMDTNSHVDGISYASAYTSGGMLSNLVVYTAAGATATTVNTTLTAWTGYTAVAGEKYFVQYQLNTMNKEIVVNADSFPGTQYIQGDTYARSDVSGKDSFFQFIIPKAKMTAEQTITLEAEGDPSTFNMNLTVLRPEDGQMMRLVQYDIVGS